MQFDLRLDVDTPSAVDRLQTLVQAIGMNGTAAAFAAAAQWRDGSLGDDEADSDLLQLVDNIASSVRPDAR